MTITKTHIVLSVIVLSIVAFLMYFMPKPLEAANANFGTKRCTTTTSSRAVLGNQVSTTILSANSARAWARIQQPINATNTVSMAFNGGSAATVGDGVQLTPATTTSPYLAQDFGLNTDFAYTGAVTAITGTGSTTVLVTECVFI